MDVEAVGHVLEDVPADTPPGRVTVEGEGGEAAPGVLDEHADTHEDAVEDIPLYLRLGSGTTDEACKK